MKFDEVNALIPKTATGDKHSIITEIYLRQVRVKSPGKYGPSDFVVQVDDAAANWKWRKFTHEDVFKDIESKCKVDGLYMEVEFATNLARVILNGDEPDEHVNPGVLPNMPGVAVPTLLRAAQVLAVCEHRRYGHFEKRGGGKFLPARFATGIIFGHWTAEDAGAVQKSGSNGLNMLVNRFGQPPKLKDLV